MSSNAISVWQRDAITVNLGPKLICYRSISELVPKKMQALKVIETIYHEVCDENETIPEHLLLWSNEIPGFGAIGEPESLALKNPMLLRASSEQFWGALNWLERPSVILTHGLARDVNQVQLTKAALAIDAIFPHYQDQLLKELFDYTKTAQLGEYHRSLIFDEGQGRFAIWNPELTTLQRQHKFYQDILFPRSTLRLRQTNPQRQVLRSPKGWAAVGASIVPEDQSPAGCIKRNIVACKLTLAIEQVQLEFAQSIGELIEQLLQEHDVGVNDLKRLVVAARDLPLWAIISDDLQKRWNKNSSFFDYQDFVLGWHPVATRLQLLYGEAQPSLLIDVEEFPQIEVVLIR